MSNGNSNLPSKAFFHTRNVSPETGESTSINATRFVSLRKDSSRSLESRVALPNTIK